MKNDPKAPKRVKSEKVRHNQITEAIRDRVLLKGMRNDTRIEEASKPMYLTRYE